MPHMNINRIARIVCAIILAASCCVALAACGSKKTSDAPSSSDPTLNYADISKGVAVTVNGVEIGEASVTAYIEQIRAQQGVTTDDAWADWLMTYGYTPETLRANIIDSFVSQELLRQAAIQEGVEVPDAQIDAQIASMKSMYGSDEAWGQALKEAGITEESFRSYLAQSALQDALMQKVAASAVASDEDVIAYLQSMRSTLDGAHRSSHILFDATDGETAQQVLEALQSGDLDFETAVAQYSKDTGSALNGGDVGWDAMTTFVAEYQTALDGLEAGEMSGLVTSQFGIHIILCTDVYNAPETLTSLDEVPADIVAKMRTSVDSNAKQAAFQSWMQAFKDSADIKVNDMPNKLSYAIDLSKYGSSSGSTATSGASTASGAVK